MSNQNKTKCLFVGGSSDGTYLNVDITVDRIHRAVVTDTSLTLEYDYKACTVVQKQETYHRTAVQNAYETYHVYLHSSLGGVELIPLLIAGYKGAN